MCFSTPNRPEAESTETTFLLPPIAMMAPIPVGGGLGGGKGVFVGGRAEWFCVHCEHVNWTLNDMRTTVQVMYVYRESIMSVTVSLSQPPSHHPTRHPTIPYKQHIPGGKMASKLSTPYIPRLLTAKVPLLYSSGASCFPRARLTRSAH